MIGQLESQTNRNLYQHLQKIGKKCHKFLFTSNFTSCLLNASDFAQIQAKCELNAVNILLIVPPSCDAIPCQVQHTFYGSLLCFSTFYVPECFSFKVLCAFCFM